MGESMKRLRRIICNGLTALSLVLCIATLAAWHRGNDHRDCVSRRTGDNRIAFTSQQGLLELLWGLQSSDLPEPSHDWNWEDQTEWQYEIVQPEQEPATLLSPLGFWRYRVDNSSAYTRSKISVIVIPWWSLSVMAAILPFTVMLRSVISRLRQSSTKKGRCRACDYDLRATPDRCPECGTGVVQV